MENECAKWYMKPQSQEKKIATPDFLLELEQPKIEQLAPTIAIKFKNDLE